MAARIEDYGMVGDCQSAALIARDGSIDWLCWPRFDSDAWFASLLGTEANGRWKIAPTEAQLRTERRYLPGTLVLETTHRTAAGTVSVIDFMPPRTPDAHFVRLVIGREGRVAMAMQLVLRAGYGAVLPWVTQLEDGALSAIAGPDRVVLRTPVHLRGEYMTTVADFEVKAGQTIPFVLSYGSSSAAAPAPVDPMQALEAARRFWADWTKDCNVEGPYTEVVRRSLITLKALSYEPTGGFVAAPTTSLPEAFGGVRNWDYRYCWVRDATLTLLALMNAGHLGEARAWVEWLHRAVAGAPEAMQIMYGVAGERRLLEWSADWLAGYEGSVPVRVGNAAHSQFQLDVYGELMDVFHHARRGGVLGDDSWPLEQAIVEHVEQVWRDPDQGVWETRSGARHFTYSKVMAWVVLDRAVKAVEEHGLDGPVERWRGVRDDIRAAVMAHAFDAGRGIFQRAYDDPRLDASLLLIADVGFIAHDDPRFAAQVEAIERELLTDDGLLLRYDTRHADDGLPPGEGAFLPCSFWLASAYAMLGRQDEATALFERLLSLANDLGLLSEEYDPAARRLCGNFPQAFTHVALVSAAMNLTRTARPSAQRAGAAA